jgi:hypothetical protein
MVTATALKLRHRDRLQWHELLTSFREDLPVGSKLVREERHRRDTDRQDGDLIAHAFALGREVG